MSARLPIVKLKRGGTHRCLAGHSWVFDNEFERPAGIAPGAEIDLVDPRGRFIGRGYYNPKSKIAVRLFSRSSRAALDLDFFVRRLEAARAIRRPFLPDSEPHRILSSEGDRCPGAIADRYGETIVFQILTLGIDARRDAFVEALQKVYRPAGIYERSDVAARTKEGLELRTGTVFGEVPDRIETATDGIRFTVFPKTGQKTGTYLDQRLNRRRFGEFASGCRVLDAFAYQGLFGLYASAAGAQSVTALESSEDACREITLNAELNDREIEVIRENAFDALKRLESEGRRFELISLDPPSFTKSSGSSDAALRGYKEINLRALRLLADGGILFTSSCSYHTRREEFIATLADAAHDSRRDVRLIEVRSASPDHPIRLEIPESDYLKCAVLRAL